MNFRTQTFFGLDGLGPDDYIEVVMDPTVFHCPECRRGRIDIKKAKIVWHNPMTGERRYYHVPCSGCSRVNTVDKVKEYDRPVIPCERVFRYAEVWV